MKKGYLFIDNGRYISKEQENSLEPVIIGSFEGASIYAANKLELKLYKGINRTYAEKLTCEEYDISFYNQHIYRRVFDLKNNWIAYRNLRHFLRQHPDVEVIHCNTPIGGVLGRICGKQFRKKVIYTAHGFHFYKGADKLLNYVFRGVEKWLARYTDAIITINVEDFEAAKKFTLKPGGVVFHLPGVGINTRSFDDVIVNKDAKRDSVGVPEDSLLGIVVGDLNDNKNVETLVKALAILPEKVHIIICGFGPNEGKLKLLADNLGVQKRCHFLGYRTDVKELYLISDVYLFASQREGLPRSTMEAMCTGLPCVVSKIRGNVDLIDDSKGGYLINPFDVMGFSNAITQILESEDLRKKFGKYNKEKIKRFDIEIVKSEMVNIIKKYI